LKDANAEKPEESNVRNNLLNTANEESNFGKMWKVLCMWKRITEDPNISFKDCCDEKFEIDMSMCKYLKKIAVVNLAKEHGKGVNNQDELNNKLAKAVKQYYDYTQKELDIIEPDIVVCCGTYYHIRDQYENCDEITLPSGAKYFTNDKTKFVEMYHPGSYTGYPVLFAYFKEVYSNLK